MAAGSSTLQSNETVSLKLPTGEMIDAVVPGGLSDEDVKSYVQMKRPDLFGAPGAQPKPPQQPMSQSAWGSIDQSDPSIPKFGGMHGGSYDIAPRDSQGQISPDTLKAEAIGGTAGIASSFAPAAARASLPFIAAQAAKHPIIAGVAGQEAIHQARQLPGVGKFIPAYAELLPWLLSGKGPKNEGGAPVERDATRGNVPYAGEEIPNDPLAPPPQQRAPVYRDATRQNVPYAGDEQLNDPLAPAQTQATPDPAANVKRPLRPTVGTPEDWQTYDQQMGNLKQEASAAGTYSAARGKVGKKTTYQQRIGNRLPFLPSQPQ